MDETTTPSGSSSLAEAMPWPTEALKAAKATPVEPEPEPARSEPAPARSEPAPAKSEPARAKAEPAPAKLEPARAKPEPAPKRDARTAAAALDEEEEPEDFSGVDTTAPVDDEIDEGPREVAVQGIQGTTSEFDVRVTLENRAEDFDRCHDQMGGGGGRIVYRIHIEADGNVGRVKARPIKSRNRKLVACYTEVVSSSRFPKPHGGYANVKWTTKVGRTSRKKRTNPLYDRPHRWDTPTGSRASR